MDSLQQLREMNGLCRSQDHWRSETINLIASENVLSPAARALLDSDFHHRYAEGHPGARYYEGTKYIDEVETRTRELICELFGADHADVRLPSATTANEAVFSAILKKGGVAFAHGIAGGGHISHAKFGALGKHADEIVELPRLADGFKLDGEATAAMIREQRPTLVILGRSLFLFPEPIEAIRPACNEVGATLLYDGSHVCGLILGGQFQDPLGEGVDLLTASTHKTFFGPQRGVVVSKGHDDAWWKPIDRAVFPGITSNHHLFSLPSLYVAALEAQNFGADYAAATIANAKSFAKALHERGFDVAAADLGYTESHQVAVDVGDLGGGADISRRLCDNGVICNMNLLPGEPRKNARHPRGLRFGVQEMTRFGMGAAEMESIADLMKDCLMDGKSIAGDCAALRSDFSTIRYGYSLEDLSETAL